MLNTPSVPAAFFGIILGLVGLGSCWREASRIWNAPAVVGESVMAIAAAVWVLLVLLFAAKWMWRRAEAVREVEDPVQCCFVGLLPVSTMLTSLVALPYGHPVAAALGIAGGTGQLAFAVYRTGQLWTGGRDPESTTPVLYLPTAGGNFVSAIVAAAFDLPDLAALLFGAGLLAWFALESVLMNRLYVHPPLAPPLRPTLGIQLAPAVVGYSAYLSLISGPPDLFAKGLLGYGLLQALIIARMLPWIMVQPFAVSYWAFTFGLTSMAFDAMKFVERGMDGLAPPLAYTTFAVANISIAIVAIGTVWLFIRGRILPASLSTITT
jgi:tellurite resistance protein